MSAHLTAIKHQQRHAYARDSRAHRMWSQFGRIKIVAVLAVVTLMLGGLYLSMLNASSVDGFALKALEQRVSELTRENDQLHFTASALSSLSRIERYAEGNDMVKAHGIQYIPDAGSAVATR